MMVRKSKGLSDKHLKVLRLIKKYQTDVGHPPTIREIGDETNITSTSVVNYYLDQLEKLDYIERDRKISRGIHLRPERMPDIAHLLGEAATTIGEMFRIPVMGRIVASEPVPVPSDSSFKTFDSETTVDVAMSLLPAKDAKNLYALEVDGDSMIDAMVNDGDYVIMRPVQNNSEVRNGEIVAIWLESSNETTLKYFYKEKDHYRLQPANPTMKPITVKKTEPLEIKGKVVMVIRSVGPLAA